MRLPTSKVYRAFAELDPFTDAQCRGFVHAANRGTIRQTIGVLLLVAVGVVVFVVSAVIFMLLADLAVSLNSPQPTLIPLTIFTVGSVGTTSLAVLGLRDVLLRCRIRRVFRRRGACASCGYTLVGLPVSGQGVQCPECGMARVAEAAEIQTDGAGLQRFLPA